MHHVYQDWLDRRGETNSAGCDTIYYTNTIDPAIIDATIKVVSSKRSFPVSALNIEKSAIPLILSKTEKIYIINELIKLKQLKWPGMMFPNSKAVAINNIHSVFKITKVPPKKHANMCSIIYTFSRPIYIRNNSICLYLDQQRYSDTDAQLTFSFYKKLHNEWEEYADCYINFGTEDGSKDDDTEAPINKQALPTENQLNVFGKKIFTAYQLQQPDSLFNFIPTKDQHIKIYKNMGLTVSDRDAAIMDTTYIKLTHILKQRYQESITKASSQNIDWPNIILKDIKIEQRQLNMSYKNPDLVYINTSMSIYFDDKSRQFRIRIPDVDFIDNECKIGSNLFFEEVTK